MSGELEELAAAIEASSAAWDRRSNARAAVVDRLASEYDLDFSDDYGIHEETLVKILAALEKASAR